MEINIKSEFPSPCGDMVLKSVFVSRYCFSKKFPSPCGDMVLKSPLKIIFSPIVSVSVPLRGYGFEIATHARMNGNLHGFRPLAGIWF